MSRRLTNRSVLDVYPQRQVSLEFLSFSGGENTVGEDHELATNEARIIENWVATSLGGMKRAPGLSEIANGGVTYTDAPDLGIQHFEGTSNEVFGVIEGDLVQLSGATLAQEDAAAFTSGLLCHAVSAGDKLWITNATDNLVYKTISGAITTPTDQPATACARIYEHNFRLIAEGGGKTVYGSMAGSGNWAGANGWTTSNDAWSMTMPDNTFGCAPAFPSGNDLAVFTEFGCYVIYNQPNVARRHIPNSHGCSAPLSIARGAEGVFFVSKYPTLGVYLWDGVNWVWLTEKHDFVNDIDFDNRIFGIYKDQEYFLFYNEDGSGVSYPNKIKIYNTQYGRWMDRPINNALSDTMGYPFLMTKTNNELYVMSAQADTMYDFHDSSTSDDGQNTEANYKTKVFTSRDFDLSTGGKIPIDGARIKLTKIVVSYKGTDGSLSVGWDADRGQRAGQQVFDMNVTGGALINDDFTVNTSSIVGLSDLPIKTISKTLNNSAVGRAFQFQILNNGTGARPEVKKIRIDGILLEDI